MKELIKKEPARLVGVLFAAIALASAFGLNLTNEQSAAIVAFVSAVMALGGMEVIRAQVTPNQTVAAKIDVVRSEVIAGPAAEDVSTASEGEQVEVLPVDDSDQGGVVG